LADKVLFAYGVEIDQDLYNIAMNGQKKNNTEYIHADATSYDYSKLRKVTAITLSNVLEHIDDRIGFLTKLKNSLGDDFKARGKVLIRVPSIEREWIAVYKMNRGVEYRLDDTHFIEYTEDLLRRELESSGLKIEEFS